MGPDGYIWNFAVVWADFDRLLSGLMVTCIFVLCGLAIVIPWGWLVALARVGPYKVLRGAAIVYADVIRSTPFFFQLMAFFMVFPILFGPNQNPFVIATSAFVLNNGVYFGEIFRASILSVDKGQREAALGSGMTERQALWRVILPQAVRRSIPAASTHMVITIQDSALVGFVGVLDLFGQGRLMYLETYRQIETLSVVAMMYVLLSFPLSRLAGYMNVRFGTAD